MESSLPDAGLELLHGSISDAFTSCRRCEVDGYLDGYVECFLGFELGNVAKAAPLVVGMNGIGQITGVAQTDVFAQLTDG